MSREARHDVVVVGGGPGGSVVAGLMAGVGLDVILLDRAFFPRSKPCGESVNPGAVRELEMLGLLPAILDLPHLPITGWRVHPHNGAFFEGRFPSRSFGLGIDRAHFDTTLIDFAAARGAQIHTGIRVVDVERVGERVTGVHTADGRTIGARLVIGADGLRSVVLRRLNLLQRAPKLHKLALTAHVTGADLPDLTGVLQAHEWGCLGIVAISPDVANVVQVVDKQFAGRIAGKPEEYFDAQLRLSAYLSRSTRCSDVRRSGPFAWPVRRVTLEGALLVGDAAGYFDPFTGQGIYRAIRGAREAARVASAALSGSDAGGMALAPYESWHQEAFRTTNTIQRIVEIFLSHASLLDGAAKVLRAWPDLGDRLITVTGDLRSARHLLPIAR